ncbi:MAG: c-type cytochrome [SAR324 cluster bacterium]|nr:c-type cytochrome [SAR324 cluster bacterium]MBL7035672.1 c-type cytochrome [SAR324 cluster bacterium]
MKTHYFQNIRQKRIIILSISLLFFGMQAFAQDTSNLTSTADFGGKWGTKVKEAIEAMQLEGNVEDGSIIYEEICMACHQPSGGGDPAGNFPQLAGQHSTVIIKQIADIRVGNRDNPTMYPFANIEALRAATEDIFDEEKSGPQTLADVSAYIQTLPMSSKIKGNGLDLEYGAEVYKENCVRCHGDHGQGDVVNYYPVIAGQNYNYLLRQFRWIKEGKRRNANPEMVKQIAGFSERDILSVMDWVSRQKMIPGDWDRKK